MMHYRLTELMAVYYYSGHSSVGRFPGCLPMNHTACKFISIVLVLCVLCVGGLAQAQAAEHAGHHAQHQTATHGTLLCSWMCAAGQGWETAGASIPFEWVPVQQVECVPIGQFPVSYEEPPATRGPPLR